VKDSVAYLGQKTACYMMRSRLCWFVKGLPMAKSFREAIKRVASMDQAFEIIDTYFSHIADREKARAASYDLETISNPSGIH